MCSSDLQTHGMNIIEHNIPHSDPAMYQRSKDEYSTGNGHGRVRYPVMPLPVIVVRLVIKMCHQVNQETGQVDCSESLQQPVTQAMSRPAHSIHHSQASVITKAAILTSQALRRACGRLRPWPTSINRKRMPDSR